MWPRLGRPQCPLDQAQTRRPGPSPSAHRPIRPFLLEVGTLESLIAMLAGPRQRRVVTTLAAQPVARQPTPPFFAGSGRAGIAYRDLARQGCEIAPRTLEFPPPAWAMAGRRGRAAGGSGRLGARRRRPAAPRR